MKRSTSCASWTSIFRLGYTVFNEQRQTQRKVLKVKALIVPEGGSPLVARTVDVSSSGMCVSVSAPIELGTHSQLRFDLLVDGKPNTIEVRSKVSYCILSGDEFKVGFQFVNLDLSSMTALAKYLR